MASPESGRLVAFERQKKSSIITRTIASGLTIGAILFTAGCVESENRVAPRPTAEVKLEIPESKLEPHCIIPYPNPILDHAKFFCDENGQPRNDNIIEKPTPIPSPTNNNSLSNTTS